MSRLAPSRCARPLAVLFLLLAALAASASVSQAATLDLANLSGADAAKMLDDGTLTSVELTQAYLDRINALNKSGPALNAVTQLNKDALRDAAESDKLRAKGVDLGPAMGLPILLKDIIDAKGQVTTAGNWSLRNSYPAEDSGVTTNLRRHGVIILGKVGLSEFANYFGGQPSGFGNLTGQVLNANDADATPSGSSSGTGAAVQASLAALGVGTETNGSIISPSAAESLVGLRPTVGLVPGYGIAPIIASQDTAGPMSRTVADAAMTLQSITGDDADVRAEADAEYRDVFGDDYLAKGIIPTPPATTPNYMTALSTGFVRGKRIGYTFTAPTSCATTQTAANSIAFCALQDAGAVLVPVTYSNVSGLGITNIEVHKTIDGYYKHLGPDAPIKSMADETADNNANETLAEKFGNHQHWINFQTPYDDASLATFRSNLATAKTNGHNSLDALFNRGTADTSDDLIAVLGSVGNTPVHGYPQITLPMGYSTTQRRATSANVYGPAYSERDLLGVGYVIEQATKLRQTPEQLNPAMYRCAKTAVAAPYASRGDCNPDYETASAAAGSTTTPDLGFKLENATVSDLQSRLTAGTLTSVALTKAYLNRIALTNAQGPGLQAVRALNAQAVAQAEAADAARASGKTGPMLGIPVLLDDSYDVAGMTTTAGSIALQNTKPTADSAVVTRLKRAGAVILGKTNITELNNVLDANTTAGYSSLGGQVLDSYDTDKTVAGSSAGSASAVSAGLAALTIGLQSSQNGFTSTGASDATQTTASAVLPASIMGVDALKPTVGRVSRVGVLGAAKSQDSPTPMATTIRGLADAMTSIAGVDPGDTQTVATGATPADYAAGLSADLTGSTIGVLPTTASTGNYSVTTTPGYNDALQAIGAAGATTTTKTISSAAADVPAYSPSVLAREFKRDLNAYLANGHTGDASTLADVIDYLTDHPVEGLKYATTGTGGGSRNVCTRSTGPLPSQLCAALNAADISSDGASADVTAYTSDRDTGQTNARTYLTTQLSGTDALLVPASSPLVGIADRAGWPVLAMQSGYQFGYTANAATYGKTGYSQTHNPYGVVLIGRADSEGLLLKLGYGIEQKLEAQKTQTIARNTTSGDIVYTDEHVAPSVYNPAMYRCIEGSVYYAPYNCHPGEVGYVSPVLAPVADDPGTGSGGGAGSGSGSGSGSGGGGTTTPTPAAPQTAPDLSKAAALLDAQQAKDLAKALTAVISSKTTTIKVSDRIREAGKLGYTLKLSLGAGKVVVLGRASRTITKPGTYTATFRLTKTGRRQLARHRTGRLILATTFVSKPTGKTIATRRAFKRAK